MGLILIKGAPIPMGFPTIWLQGSGDPNATLPPLHPGLVGFRECQVPLPLPKKVGLFGPL